MRTAAGVYGFVVRTVVSGVEEEELVWGSLCFKVEVYSERKS